MSEAASKSYSLLVPPKMNSQQTKADLEQQAQLSCLPQPSDVRLFILQQFASYFLVMGSRSLTVILSFLFFFFISLVSLSFCILVFSLVSPLHQEAGGGGGGGTKTMTEQGGWVVEITC